MNSFGGLLTSFQKQTKLALELARRALKKRNPKVTDYEFRESKIITHTGETVYSIELWQKVDEEHIRFNTKVEAETLPKADLKKLKNPPQPPIPAAAPPEKEPEMKDILS